MNVSVMTTTMTHKFKYPKIFKLLEQVEVSEVENYGIFMKIGTVLRSQFSSLKDMEARQWICTFVSGDRQFKKFKKEFQEMIYHTFSKRDRTRPAEAGAGCLSGPAGHSGKIYGITSLRITCNL